MVREFTFEGARNTRLQGYVLEPPANIPVRALMVIIHGLGEHVGRYLKYLECFTGQGILIYSMDLRGHGRSSGKRGHTAPRSLVLEDVDILCRIAEKDHPDKPLFIYGHSMGGNIGLHHRLHGKFRPKGYIITSPWITLYKNISGPTIFFMKIISTFAPQLCIRSNIDINELSSDKSQIDAGRDPLYHGFVSVQTGLDCYEAALEILRRSDVEKEELLLLHGTDDHLCSVEGSRLFMKNAPKSCTYKEFEGCYHELHHDIDREKVSRTINDWINGRI
ncbi:MAG TPA: alpha/beta hydrolase [Clostridiaceae bacterium]|jgi:acylglycerol lipase|nr:alpha/beta hydrolase [Clostridiaceae bacterium]